MRIQHNILAMNAYRNYNTNTSALAKNLEKLSSGYKINRAGDDAAGLAISEKMRAQITGLNAASKNVKDGISLVKTAEGAMQEIQDMLNRMDYLATQSANGTYDDPVDRANLQKEMDALKSEINRIADSANFNGINLLDGSKAAVSTSALGGASAALLEGINGSAPTKAGAAEILLKLANNAATGSSPLKPNTSIDGTAPTAATKATATFTLGAASTTKLDFAGSVLAGSTALAAGSEELDLSVTFQAGDKVMVGGKTYTYDATADGTDLTKFKDAAQLKAAMASDGLVLDNTTANKSTATTASKITLDGGDEILAGFTNIDDIKDLTYDGTNAIGDLFDVTVMRSNAEQKTGTIAAGDKIILTAKTAGKLNATNVDAKLGAATANNGGKVEYTAGVDEGYPSAPSAVTKYDLEIDLTKLRGGQRIEVGGKVIEFKTDGTASTAGTAGTAADPYIVNLNEADTGTDGNLDEIGGKLKAALDAVFGTTNFKVAVSSTTGDTFKYSIEGKSNTLVDASNMGEIRLFEANGDEAAAGSAFKADYTPAATAGAGGSTPTPFASVEYELTTDQLKTGNKITIGDKTIEIVAATADEDLANGKATVTNITKALEQMGYTSGKATLTGTGTAGDPYKLKITGVTAGEKAADLAKGAGKVSLFDASKATASEATVAGSTDMNITAGKTKISDLLGAAMPDDVNDNAKTLGDLFDITVNGATKTDDYVIQEGDEIKFTAKVNGKLGDDVMNRFKYDGSVDSLSSKDGWDEGQGASGDKTHYELAIDVPNVAGGNSFTFGNVNGKSVTFELSYDPDGTKNDSVGAEDKDDISGNATRININLFGLTTAEAQEKIYQTVKTEMGKAKFDVTRAISGGKMTLNLDAQEEGADYNLGNIRLSSANGALSNAVYNPAGGAAGGTEGTMAQVTYKFDASQLQSGDSLTLGGTTIYFGDETKTETVDGKVKITVSAEEAKADPNAAIVKALESAGYRSGQVKFDTDNKTITITGIKTGETADELQKGGAALTLSGGGRELVKGGLTLQIGDTSDDFNQMTVSIGDMHTGETGLKIDSARIDTQENAKAAIQSIKDAINYVSSVRGDLGATQNRLEHTANNLSVMAENIQDAESTIRDTDIAEEMMAYTKNNILIQSAQAMLAQANAVPQGVLQLLG